MKIKIFFVNDLIKFDKNVTLKTKMVIQNEQLQSNYRRNTKQ